MAKASNIKRILNLDRWEFRGNCIFNDIPDDLIEIAFRPSHVHLKRTFKEGLVKKYGFSNLEDLEFMGDAVLELVAANLVFRKSKGGPGYMTQKKSEMVRNTTLFCFMEKLKLCDYIETNNYSMKDCADVFESIIGMMYYYLLYILKNELYIFIMESYLIETFYDDDTMADLLQGKIQLDKCSINYKKNHRFNKNPESRFIREETPQPELSEFDKFLLELSNREIAPQELSENTIDTIRQTYMGNNIWLKSISKKTDNFTNKLRRIYGALGIRNYIETVYKEKPFVVQIKRIDFEKLEINSVYISVGDTENQAIEDAAKLVVKDILNYFSL